MRSGRSTMRLLSTPRTYRWLSTDGARSTSSSAAELEAGMLPLVLVLDGTGARASGTEAGCAGACSLEGVLEASGVFARERLGILTMKTMIVVAVCTSLGCCWRLLLGMIVGWTGLNEDGVDLSICFVFFGRQK